MASTQSNSSEMQIQEPKVQENLDQKDFSDLEAGPTDENPESKSDINLVNWDTDDDPANPLNWSPSHKWQNLGVISIMSLTTYVPSLFLCSFPSMAHHIANTPQTVSIHNVCTRRSTSND